ncbi:hypothetical protein Taro_004622 [Colocasia esculenta]|uniref:Uncharacterized protein n=1 Tax=Colocasia esculenta TaxID=4460 RepID=A0A843TS53_COLES|nr:hypothetical protein [Colocasia esculenta]
MIGVVSTLDQVVSTPCSKPKTKTGKTGQVVSTLVQVVSTLVQVVSTQCFKCKTKQSSSVDTSPGGVDTRDSSQNTFWPSWDSVSTLAHVVSTLEAFPEPHLGCFGTAGGVDTRDSSQNTFWPSWDSVSTLAHVVSTLEAFPEPHLGCFGTAGRH